MINIPSLLVRIDSEKHDDSTLSRRLYTEIVRETDKGALSAKQFQTELDVVRRKFRLDEQALSNKQVCLHDDLSRGGDMAQPFGSDQVV